MDTFSAIWLSNSSINDFLNCPRAYYLKNQYKNPATNRKIALVSKSMSLGLAVHDVLDSLKLIPAEERFKKSLLTKYEEVWRKYSGKAGGFLEVREEEDFKLRGTRMLERVMEHPGPLVNKATNNLRSLMQGRRGGLPSYWLSEEEGIILCGNIDWIEYIAEDDSIHIIDFKTGRNREREGSLQLPIYFLLATNCQNRKIKKASYWYLSTSSEPEEATLPNADDATDQIANIGKGIKTRLLNNVLECPSGGCQHCRPFEDIITGKAEYLGEGPFNKDIYLERTEADSYDDLI